MCLDARTTGTLASETGDGNRSLFRLHVVTSSYLAYILFLSQCLSKGKMSILIHKRLKQGAGPDHGHLVETPPDQSVQ